MGGLKKRVLRFLLLLATLFVFSNPPLVGKTKSNEKVVDFVSVLAGWKK